MKPIYKIIIYTIAVVAITLWFTSCPGKETKGEVSLPYVDTLNQKYAVFDKEKAVLTSKIDSIEKELIASKQVKTVYLTRYIEVGRSLTAEDSLNCPDVVNKFNDLKRAADSLNAVNDSIIGRHESRDSLYISTIQIQEKQLAIKDTVNQILTESLENTTKDLEKANKKVKRNRVIAGISSAVAVIFAIF